MRELLKDNMSRISVIDCTLRDGGYVNNWDFSNEFQCKTINTLINSKINIIECGFLSDQASKSDNTTLFRSVEQLNTFLAYNSLNQYNCKYALMLNLGEYSIDNILKCDRAKNCVTVIRIAFKKDEILRAKEFASLLIDKSYDVHIQPTAISHYTDEEIVEMLNIFSEINYTSISIVDTFGALSNEDVKRITRLYDKYANKMAMIAFHGHNNLSQAFSNALAFINSVSVTRDVFVDTSIYGIGRGTGNLQTEVFLAYLKNEKKYNFLVYPITNFICNEMEAFKNIMNSSNSYFYLLTAKKNMHPNYATYLIHKNYSKNEIINILERVDTSKYLVFDYEYIHNLCENLQIKSC